MKAADKGKRRTPAGDVDAYLAGLPDDVRITLQKLRKTIKAAAPQAKEGISYGMPVYKQNGVLVYFGAFTNHCSFFPANKAMLAHFRAELKSFETTGGTIHFTSEHPLPATLVKKIVKARLAENTARRAKRA